MDGGNVSKWRTHSTLPRLQASYSAKAGSCPARTSSLQHRYSTTAACPCRTAAPMGGTCLLSFAVVEWPNKRNSCSMASALCFAARVTALSGWCLCSQRAAKTGFLESSRMLRQVRKMDCRSWAAVTWEST
eukprot:1158750-Pelagomonas_calceolata.AAC.2